MISPSAIFEMVFRYFGETNGPNWAATPQILAREPYREVRESLSDHWEVIDDTDPNYALGFMYLLEREGEQVWVRLSVVGPFALVHATDGTILRDPIIDEVLRVAGFSVISRETLELPVGLWGPAHSKPLYEYLFEFDEGLPWAR